MNVAVYLGSSYGRNPKYAKITEEIGTYIGMHYTLVFGASDAGLMHILVEAAKKEGGKVIGVNAELFSEYSYGEIDDLYVYPTISQRREKMSLLGDAFLALPGGVGTLDEISEIICYASMKERFSPVILYNLEGFFDPLKAQLEKMIQEKFVDSEIKNRVHFVTSFSQIKKVLEGKAEELKSIKKEN